MTTRMLTLALLLLLSTPAHAALVRGRNTMSILHQWTWTGQCVTECVGTATAEMTALADVLPAQNTSFAVGPLLTAVYTDDEISFDLGSVWQDGSGIFYSLPASGSGPGNVTVEVARFRQFSGGAWSFVAGPGTRPNCDAGVRNYLADGINGVWTESPIPWPATLLLLLGGISLLCLPRRNRGVQKFR